VGLCPYPNRNHEEVVASMSADKGCGPKKEKAEKKEETKKKGCGCGSKKK